MSTETRSSLDFVFNVGEDEHIPPRPMGMAEETGPTRGLTLREITLHRSYEGWLGRLFHRNQENEIFFITTAFDMSGGSAQSYPESSDDAENAWVPLVAGETHKFSLGTGVPLWGPKPVTGGIAAAIIIGESDAKSKQVGEVIREAADAFKSDDSISAFLGKLVTSPGSIPADVVFGVLGKAASAAGAILEKNKREHVGLFRGLFPAKGSWDGMLEETQRGATVKLGKTP